MVTSAETAGPRWLELEGADNVRDLGGLPLTGGGQTRFGRLVRASTLQHLTAADVAHLVGDVGLRTVVDLRLPGEAAAEGSALAGRADVDYLSLPVWSADRVPADVVASAAEMDVVDHYLALLDGSVDALIGACRVFADPGRVPALFHCAAGKDRTGVLAALVLDASGVTPAAIVADYALTAQRLDLIRERLSRLETYRRMRAVSTGRGVMTADADTMARFLERLHRDHGGAGSWLLAHGLSTAELDALRASLVAG
jgi:protein tyrosine/serine phosphatase